MKKKLLGVFLLTVAVLAAKPIPSKVITFTISNLHHTTGSITISDKLPPGTQLFDDGEEILASINTGVYYGIFCSLGMTTVTTTN